MGKVLIACTVAPILVDGLSNIGYDCIIVENITRSIALGLVQDCVGIITSTKLNIDKELIDAAPLLKWVGRMGSGMEIIDLDYAVTKKIACYSSPEGNCNAVAEHALGMLLALIRRIAWSRAELLNGIWQRDQNRGIELEGKTIAIIGYGHTGSTFAKKLKGFDMQILAYDKYHPEKINEGIINCNDLGEIFNEADIISFHLPLQQDTLHFFNEAFCNSMKKPFLLINTSRGQVVDTLALYNGLKYGKIIGACIDVFEEEPPFAKQGQIQDYIKEIIAMPQVVATPHIAGYTFEAVYKMSKTLLDKISVNCV